VEVGEVQTQAPVEPARSNADLAVDERLGSEEVIALRNGQIAELRYAARTITGADARIGHHVVGPVVLDVRAPDELVPVDGIEHVVAQIVLRVAAAEGEP